MTQNNQNTEEDKKQKELEKAIKEQENKKKKYSKEFKKRFGQNKEISYIGTKVVHGKEYIECTDMEGSTYLL